MTPVFSPRLHSPKSRWLGCKLIRVLVNCSLMLARTGNTCPATVTCRRNPQCHGLTVLQSRACLSACRHSKDNEAGVDDMGRAQDEVKLCLLFHTHITLLIEKQLAHGQGLFLSRLCVCKHSRRVRAVDTVIPTMWCWAAGQDCWTSEMPGKSKSDCIRRHGGVMKEKKRLHLSASI